MSLRMGVAPHVLVEEEAEMIATLIALLDKADKRG